MSDSIQSSSLWLPPPDALHLPLDTIDVWRGIVELPEAQLQAFWTLLNQHERDRADRFKFPIHRNRFIAARGMLRVILGRYLSRAPEEISFTTGPHGKPHLASDIHSESLFFNLAHSQDLALFAISRDREVGVDLEWNRPDLDYHSLVPRIMADTEIPLFSSLPAEVQRPAFFACWTKKEAYLKARGEGLTRSMKNICVAVSPKERPAFLEIHDDSGESDKWILQELYPGQDYTAALAAPSPPWHTRCWEYPTA